MRRSMFTWRGWLLVWLLPLLIVGGLVAALVASRPGPSGAASGAGDRYYPEAGASGWDALSYVVRVRWDAASGVLSGTTTIEGVATAHLPEIHVDLKYAVASATVNGFPARASAGASGVDRVITPVAPLRAGDRFTATVSYAGDPDRLDTRADGDPFMRAGDEAVIAGEPESAAVWFAANDHPTDPARFEVYATVPAGQEALSIGRLVSRDADDDPFTATWHWVSDEEAATYLTFLAMGQFEIAEGVDAGRPYVYAVSERLLASERAVAMENLRRTGEVVRELETRYGPYPYGQLGGVVLGVDPWWGALETQGRPVYDDGLARRDDWAEELLVHELSHQWFGNYVRVRAWSDIVNNEGWATFVAADWAARHGGDPMEEWLRSRWSRASERFWRPSISDPGVANMFGTTYDRGGMALAALRRVLGEPAFDALARAWVAEPGARSLADFQAFVEARTGRDLSPFWAAWYEAPTAPAKTAELGWPGP